eukprot:gene24508-10501_t
MVIDWFLTRKERRRHWARLNAIMQSTEDFDTWWKTARRMDELNGFDFWRSHASASYYDYKVIKDRVNVLKRLRETDNVRAMAFAMRS